MALGGAISEDSLAWDNTLRQWPRPHLLQSYGWGALQATAGWTVHRLAVSVDTEKLLPVTVLVGRAGLPGLPPRLYVPKGPACAPGDTSAWQRVLQDLDVLARQQQATSIVVEPPVWKEETSELPIGRHLMPDGQEWHATLPLQPAATAIVDLRGGDDEILQRMRPKGRYNVRLAQKKGVRLLEDPDPHRASTTLAALCAATARRQHIHLPTAAFFSRVLRLVPGARILFATIDGQPAAGLLVADFAGEAIYLYGGSDDRFRDLQPSALLQFSAMSAAAATGCARYDLWGIPDNDSPRNPWRGLRQFKMSLGGVEAHTAGAFECVRRPRAQQLVNAVTSARQKVGTLGRRMYHITPSWSRP